MFREMRRFKQQTSEEECREILHNEKRGVLAVIGDDGYPFAIPMNFYYDEKDNAIYFHGAKNGHKIDALKVCDKVCFTVNNQGYKNDDEWFWRLKSVVVFGRAELIFDPEISEKKARAFGAKYFPSQDYLEAEIKSSFAKMQLIVLHIEHMTGKNIKER